ncbi:hypothetical protein THAOC_06806, partial [Thalassiosira oceanica]
GEANCSRTTSLRRTAVGNIESRLIDAFTPAAASSDLQIRTRTGGQPTEVPPRCRRGAPTQISGQKEVWMVPDGHAALQGLSSIPHLTSVAAGFYRSDVINGSGTSAGRARAMMHKFAVAPARLIDNGGRAMGAVIGPPGEAMEELDSPYRRCAGRADRDRQALLLTTISYFEGVGEVLQDARGLAWRDNGRIRHACLNSNIPGSSGTAQIDVDRWPLVGESNSRRCIA